MNNLASRPEYSAWKMNENRLFESGKNMTLVQNNNYSNSIKLKKKERDFSGRRKWIPYKWIVDWIEWM